MKRSKHPSQEIGISLARLALGAATLLACVPTLAQSDPWQSKTRVMLEFAMPFGIDSQVAHQRPYLGLTLTHAMGPQSTRYAVWDSNRLTVVDVRFDPQSGSFSKFGVGALDFSNRPRVYATEVDAGSGSNGWTPGAVLGGIAVAGGVLALLLHEAASVVPPGCTVVGVNLCK